MKIRNLFLAMLLAVVMAAPALAVRQTLTPFTPTIGTGGTVAANAADITFTAADTTNKEQVAITGREIVIVYNSDGVNPYTVTFTSAPDQLGRTGDITTYSLAAGEYAVFGPFPLNGWRQTTGKLYFEASNAAVKYAVIRIPAI